MRKMGNKILSMLLVLCMMVGVLVPLGTVIASAAGNNAQSEDGVPTTYNAGGVDYELVKGAFKYTSAEYEEMSAHFYY